MEKGGFGRLFLLAETREIDYLTLAETPGRSNNSYLILAGMASLRETSFICC